jgi:hypothetical protein
MLAAEARALYFADLASSYTRRKQLITGVSFFLSSGAAATLLGKVPSWIPLILPTAVALTNAYSMASIVRQEKEPSELATTEAPNDQTRLGKWQDRVFEMYRPTGIALNATTAPGVGPNA